MGDVRDKSILIILLELVWLVWVSLGARAYAMEDGGRVIYPKALEPGERTFKNMLEVGSEFDSNTRRTLFSMGAPERDMLIRAYFSSKGEVHSDDRKDRVGYHLQFGGRKYIQETNEDAFLGNGSVDYSHWFRPGLSSTLNISGKGKLKNGPDDNFAKLRVGDDLLVRLSDHYFLTEGVSYELFQFDNQAYNYHRMLLHNEVGFSDRPWNLSGFYEFGNWIFPDFGTAKTRWDQTHRMGALGGYDGNVIIRLGYDYNLGYSNDSRWDWVGHRVSLLLGYELVSGTTLSVLAGLNHWEFLANSRAARAELERQVRSETEDEVLALNNLIVNISQHLTDAMSLEFRYFLYTNEFLFSAPDRYTRHLASAGLKAKF